MSRQSTIILAALAVGSAVGTLAHAQPVDPKQGSSFEWPAPELTKTIAQMTPFERGALVGRALRADPPLINAAQLLDNTPGALSQSQLVAYSGICARVIDKERLDTDLGKRMALYGMCASDMARLDRAAFAAELEGLDEPVKARALAHFDYVVRRRDAIAAEAATAIEADDGIKQLVVELPTKARSDWAAAVAASKGAYALGQSIVDKSRTGSRKTIRGCEDELWPAFEGWVKAHYDQLEDTQPFEELAKDAPWNVFLTGFDICFVRAGREASQWGAADGERAAIREAIWASMKTLKFDVAANKFTTLSALFSPGGGGGSWLYAPGAGNTARFGGGLVGTQGVIATVDDDASGKRVTFKNEKVKVKKCVADKETNKIDAIKGGKIIYRRVCTRWEDRLVDTTPGPIVVHARFAAELKPGRYAAFQSMEGPADSLYIPTSVHSGKDEKSKVVARVGVTK